MAELTEDQKEGVKAAVTEAVGDDLDAKAREAVDDVIDSKIAEMKESGDMPAVHRGETPLYQMFKAMMGDASFDNDDTRAAMDKSDWRARNGKTAEMLNKMKAGVPVDGAYSKRHDQPVKGDCKGLPHYQSWNRTQSVGDGRLAAKWLWYASKSAKDAGVGANNLKKIKQLADHQGDKQISSICEKSLESSDFDQGGSLLPAPVSEDVINFLHGQTTFRQLDPVIVPLENGSMDFGRIDSAVNVSWSGELSTVNASTPGTGEVKLDARYLQAVVIISKQMRRHANVGILEVLREHIRREARATEELAFLRGTGTSSEPEGLRNLVSSANQDLDRQQSGSTSTAAEILGDVVRLQEEVYGAGSEVIRERPAYIMQHRTKSGLMALTDAENRPTLFADQLAQDQIMGVPVGTTTQLPENLDVDTSGHSDHTELYFAEMSEVMIGDDVDIQLNQTTEGTVIDGSGNRHSTFANDSIALKLSHGVDLALMHDTGAANLKNVDWGADILS